MYFITMNLPFDKIYVLHLCEHTKRYYNVINEFKTVNIENYEFWYTSIRNISNYLGKLKKSLHTEYYDTLHKDIYGRVLNCTLEHYKIIKTSYNLGYKNILIFEDDFMFNIDNKTVEYIFNNLPKDYDVIKFFADNDKGSFVEYNVDIPKNELFNKVDNFTYNYSSTMCYALSRKGMEMFMKIYENYFEPADFVFTHIKEFNVDNLNIYKNKYKMITPGYDGSLILFDRPDVTEKELI